MNTENMLIGGSLIFYEINLLIKNNWNYIFVGSKVKTQCGLGRSV